VDEARRLGHHYIGTEHILPALLRTNQLNSSSQTRRQQIRSAGRPLRIERDRILLPVARQAAASRSGPSAASPKPLMINSLRSHLEG
jgi:hypothetical protein